MNQVDVIFHAVNFGLIILATLVQLIIYPSFHYYEKAKLLANHGDYAKKITTVVMPMMLFQLVAAAYLLYTQMDWQTILYAVMVLGTWGVTFFQAIPLHEKVARDQQLTESINGLVRVNLYRTILWYAAFIWALYLELALRF